MEKSTKQLIDAFKKANKLRRQKIVEKNGCKTSEDYLNSLTTGVFKKSKKKTKTKISKTKEKLDYVVAFDTTGSMCSYIDDVKRHVEKLIPEMFSQDIDLRMKIVAFGDYCDMNGKDNFGRAYQESLFTADKEKLINFVKTAKNTSGGDSDEFYELVIKKIVNETPWRSGSKRAVLFIADDKPHPVGYSYSKSWGNGNIVQNSQIDWKQEAKTAATLNITFDTLSIHGNAVPWYKELSKITGGVYMPFQSSHKMSEVVAASAYVRGSKMSKTKFSTAYASAVDSGDEELIGTYKSLSSLL